jgi:hypothetical protein
MKGSKELETDAREQIKVFALPIPNDLRLINLSQSTQSLRNPTPRFLHPATSESSSDPRETGRAGERIYSSASWNEFWFCSEAELQNRRKRILSSEERPF